MQYNTRLLLPLRDVGVQDPDDRLGMGLPISMCVCIYIYIYTHIYIHTYIHPELPGREDVGVSRKGLISFYFSR